MPTVGFGRMNADTKHEELVEIVAKMQKTLDYILQTLDSKNIRAEGIEARNIKAGAIVTDKLDAGAVTTDKLEAGAVTAEKISVGQLSAISADMGELTAGKITTDAEINVGTDARIGNILYLNETDGTDDKGIVFNTVSGAETSIDVQSGDISIRALGGNIYLTAGIGGDVYANGGRVATQGISVSVDLMGADGSAVTLEFDNGVLTDVD